VVSLVLKRMYLGLIEFGERLEVERFTSDKCGPAKQLGVFAKSMSLGKLPSIENDFLFVEALCE
jgi:hypothetical protein